MLIRVSGFLSSIFRNKFWRRGSVLIGRGTGADRMFSYNWRMFEPEKGSVPKSMQ